MVPAGRQRTFLARTSRSIKRLISGQSRGVHRLHALDLPFCPFLPLSLTLSLFPSVRILSFFLSFFFFTQFLPFYPSTSCMFPRRYIPFLFSFFLFFSFFFATRVHVSPRLSLFSFGSTPLRTLSSLRRVTPASSLFLFPYTHTPSTSSSSSSKSEEVRLSPLFLFSFNPPRRLLPPFLPRRADCLPMLSVFFPHDPSRSSSNGQTQRAFLPRSPLLSLAPMQTRVICTRYLRRHGGLG